jgi:hypothetical protein
MIKLSLPAFAAGLILVAVAAQAGPAANRVSGGGTVDWPQGRVTYGFTAQVDGFGNAKGRARIQLRDVGTDLHAAVTCLSVLGTDAWLGAVVTDGDGDIPEGTNFVWRVRDNGTAAADPADRLSALAWAPAGVCHSRPDFTLLEPWDNGEVRVR